MRLAPLFLLAFAYLLTGMLVSHTGLHAQIIPLWIPAGLALAAGIRFGYGVLPGAALGSLIFNLGQPSGWSFAFDAAELAAAVLISGGVLLQAVVGTWLVRHKTGNPLTARGEGRVIRFILLTGFAACMISATIGTLALNLLIQPEGSAGLVQDWLSWWLGDSFGAILITPLALALLTRRGQYTSRPHHFRLIHLFTGALLAILLTNQVYLLQLNNQLGNTFQRDMDVFHANLNRLYHQNLADLGKLERQFVQQQGMTAADFREATSAIFANNPSIRAYSWDPIVLPAARQRFETETRLELNRPDYAIYGDSPHPDDPLVVVQYVEPLELNTAALGFNLLSIEDRRRWVVQSQETGRAVATQILNLTQAPDEPGLLILQPVYLNARIDDSSLLSTEKQLVGFMVGVFTVSRMIDAAIELSHLQGIRVELTESGQAQPFYTRMQGMADNSRFTSLLSHSFDFDFAQQIWHFQISAGPTYLALSPGNNVLPFQSLLVLFSALVTAVILGMHNRETTLAHRVSEQTRNLAFQAQHDPLTGLPNRMKLENDLENSLANPETSHLALMFIDLDRFKLINDSLGHLTGDHLLVELAARWMQELDETATLYRMGGDEFILLQHLPGKDRHHPAIEMAEKLLKSTCRPLQVDGMQLQVTASIGLVFSPSQGRDFNSLVRNADTALHQAKASGKNRMEIYQSSQTDATLLNFELEQDLRLAVNTPQILLHYQPQFSLDDQQLCGLEALVRWQHPHRGMIPPDQFIPLAEETQLIIPLGWQVIDLACRQLAEWLEQGEQPQCVAVNISPLQLLQSDFIEQLNLIVDAYGLSRRLLELEITETLLHQDPDFAFKQLKSLRLAGYRLALDDFGTGYSSFDRLKYMPLDRIKIDRSFVRDIGKNPKDEAIILSIIGLGKSLDIEVLAEGVEDASQQAFLKQHGCDSVQGYLLGRPVAQPVLSRAV
ncbi:bifunctional diguanylate cyclase/phosphodiesterase [Marinospirillum alkaliphilum]|uniref:bifunctional diguanylate cyclase/phosphodiesterase n=1 Tax=Marinospirillum alkaliphilum TaxID=148454 RepID=UPI0009312A66|nr:EAL domain-containing protein [Marinospirillum alkaliphilum]